MNCFYTTYFSSCGFSNILTEQCTAIFSVKWISAVIKQKFLDQFIQKWSNDIYTSPNGQIYKIKNKTFDLKKNYEHFW